MTGHDATETTTSTTRRACLVEGCPCKDARIVSTRRATYFASVARANGETAQRRGRGGPVVVLPVWSEPVARAADGPPVPGRCLTITSGRPAPASRSSLRDDAHLLRASFRFPPVRVLPRHAGPMSRVCPGAPRGRAPMAWPGRHPILSPRWLRTEPARHPTGVTPMTDAISMDRLTKHYRGVEALTDLTLDVPPAPSSASLAPTARARRPPSRSSRGSPERHPAPPPSTASRCRQRGSIVAISAISPRTPASTAG